MFDAGDSTGLIAQEVASAYVEYPALRERDGGEREGAERWRGCEVLPASERRRLLVEWNATEAEYPRERCLHELFEMQAARSPHATAVVSGEERVSYGELNARANRLAHRLRKLGVGPDERVGVCLERGVPMVVSLLAVLKAGGAYVPLDPTYPAERLAFMVEDSNPRVLLVDGSGRRALSSLRVGCEQVQVDGPDAGSESGAPEELGNVSASSLGLRPSHLAYVIYTSGSTGRPKGAMNEHTGVVNRVVWMRRAYGIDEREVVFQKTPFTFDVSVWEFFLPLVSGSRLVLARPEGHKDPAYLTQVVVESGVTVMHFVPSMLQSFLAHAGAEQCVGLKRVMCSGEALSPALARRFHERLPGVELHNLYGPTEAGVDVTAWRCEPGEVRESVPIGRPIANTRIYILDGHLQPVPQGVSGEICIGGVQVGRGYLNRAELTTERFVPDPYGLEPGGRMYKTGDLGRWRGDGAIEYLGRNDFQVKVRGQRIELGEIEARLSTLPGVNEVVVVAREDEPGDQRLVAYYVGSASVEAEGLRAHAQEALPESMVPAAYVRLEALPLTSSGKLDRRALPAPDGSSYVTRGYESPRGEVEEALAGIWSEVLKREQVGRHDNFFELGGHSLMAVTVAERMRRAGLHSDVRALFMSRTLAELASAVDGRSREVQVPPNAIAPGTTAIEPSMLPLVSLTQEAIDRIVAQVPGGAANVQDIYPLAPLQQGILFHHLMDRAGDTYLLPNLLAFTCREALDRCLRMLQAVIDRHDILRTSVVWSGLDEPVQVVHRQVTLAVDTIDCGPGDAVTRIKELYNPARYRIDVAKAPLLKAVVAWDASRERWLLLLLLHHLVADHTTLELLDPRGRRDRGRPAGRTARARSLSKLRRPGPPRRSPDRARSVLSRAAGRVRRAHGSLRVARSARGLLGGQRRAAHAAVGTGPGDPLLRPRHRRQPRHGHAPRVGPGAGPGVRSARRGVRHRPLWPDAGRAACRSRSRCLHQHVAGPDTHRVQGRPHQPPRDPCAAHRAHSPRARPAGPRARLQRAAAANPALFGASQLQVCAGRGRGRRRSRSGRRDRGGRVAVVGGARELSPDVVGG